MQILIQKKEAQAKIALPHSDTLHNPFLNDSVNLILLDISINLPAGRFVLFTDFETPISNKKDITLLSIQDDGSSSDDSQFKIYPNPSNSTFVINYSLLENFVSISVYDIIGRK